MSNSEQPGPLTYIDFLATPGDIKYPMTYNRTFSKEPSAETNTAWDSLFPRG